jgi:hypothetical protein
MAATPAQQRRYQAALRKVLARFRTEQPKKYRKWLDEALAEYDREAEK